MLGVETSPADSSPLGVQIIAGSGTATASNSTASTAQAGTEQMVTMAMHRASETGSRPTQLIGPCMLPAQQGPVVADIQNWHTGVDPARDMKSLSFNTACQYQMEIWQCLLFPCGWGLGFFLRWWPPSTMWAGRLIFLWPPRGMSE